MNKGMVYVFTGEGKGKTSAAVGVAVRAVGVGLKVGWVAFFKQESWKLAEVESLKKLGVEVCLSGKGFYLKGQKMAKIEANQVVVDSASQEDHKLAAREAMKKVGDLLKQVDVLVLDEVNNAISEGLLRVEVVLELIEERNKTHLILTGRSADKKIIKVADLVTEMKKVKHPYDQGKLAVRGLDY